MGLDELLAWQGEPKRWSLLKPEEVLRIEPNGGTDFWQKTHYGFEADNGHFLFAAVAGDFTATVRIRLFPVHQYDQAGLMVRLSSACWLKTSVEFEIEGPSLLGAVVTNGGYSDWSMQAYSDSEVWLRIARKQSAYIVSASRDGNAWHDIRIASLAEDDGLREVSCGVYACSPKGEGFAAEFREFQIESSGHSARP